MQTLVKSSLNSVLCSSAHIPHNMGGASFLRLGEFRIPFQTWNGFQHFVFALSQCHERQLFQCEVLCQCHFLWDTALVLGATTSLVHMGKFTVTKFLRMHLQNLSKGKWWRSRHPLVSYCKSYFRH